MQDTRSSVPQEGSAVDHAVALLRAMIRDRGLSVGDVLPTEGELATLFGLSRNTIREALRILRAYGVIDPRQKVGAVIVDRREAAMMELFSFAIDVSADTFRDIQGFRRLIEVNLGPMLFPRLDDATIAALQAANDAMAAAPDAYEAARLDCAFHRLLVDATGNRTLAAVYAMLEPVLRRLMEDGKRSRRGVDSAVSDHRDILKALADRDALGLPYLMSRHLDAGLTFVPAR
jgi:DNA-binding FadR family transcriptional regulator